MKKSAYLFAAVAVLAASVLASCGKDNKVEPTSPVINENAVAVTGITLDQTIVKFTKKEQTALITATVTPENATDKRVLWKSSDESVAKVSNGVVESVKEGTATITATTYAGGFVASCAVSFPKVEVDSRAVDMYGSSDKTIYWSSVNFGAENPQDFGSFLAWGELDPKSEYNWGSYMVKLIGWCGTDKDPLKGIASISNTANDVVKAKWGEGWRMPTAAEVYRLISANTWTWTSNEGVYGYNVENPTSGKSIFLPVGGYYDDAKHAHEGAKGRYWTATAGDAVYNAYSLDFNSDEYTLDQHARNLGFVIRPVLDK